MLDSSVPLLWRGVTGRVEPTPQASVPQWPRRRDESSIRLPWVDDKGENSASVQIFAPSSLALADKICLVREAAAMILLDFSRGFLGVFLF